MQLNKAILTTLLLNLAVSTPANPSNDEDFTPELLAPHIAREIVDKSPVIQVNTIDKINSLPISHIERHISSDSCPDLLKFTQRNGNPILLLSRLNDTFLNWENQPDDISISITHPPFHGQDIFLRPTISLFGTLQKLENLSTKDLSNLKQCFKRLHRASDEWLNEVDGSGVDGDDAADPLEQDLFFAEFDVNEVKFVGDFGYGVFNGVIDGESYHQTVPAHEIPPCPWHLPPRDDNKQDEEKSQKGHSKKHHGNKKGRKHGNSSKKHHGNKNGEEHEEHDMKHHGNKMDIDHQPSDYFDEGHKNNEMSHQDNQDDGRSVAVVPNSQTIFEILKIWFNNY